MSTTRDMEWDVDLTVENNSTWSDSFIVSEDRMNLSCAFGEAFNFYDPIQFPWETLCNILDFAEDICRPIFFTVTEKQKELLALVRFCPYIREVAEVKSRVANYKVFMFVAEIL